MKKVVFTLITLWLFSMVCHAKSMLTDSIIKPTPRPSLLAMSALKVGNMYLKIVYGQPLKKGRTIFGALEPYGKVWRTGANEATEVTFTKDVKINNKILKAGTYTLFSIPEQTKWTIIFNSELGQWGAYKYNPAKDVLSIVVDVKRNEVIYEALTFTFVENPTGADLIMQWDDIKLGIPLVFSK